MDRLGYYRAAFIIALLFAGCSTKEPSHPLPPSKTIVKPSINLYYRLLPQQTKRLKKIVAHSSQYSWQERIDALSSTFLNTPYGLVKRDEYPPQKGLIIQLDCVDCMSFVEYVEALARSKNLQEFPKHLRFVRYRQGIVADSFKRHFFTDWLGNGYEDIAKKIAPKKAIKVTKLLNAKRQIKAIAPFWRTFFYIPSKAFNQIIFAKLQTGDIVGAYAAKPSQDWLDVTHMGIIVVKNGTPYFRNASSLKRNNRVVDIPLKEYLKRVPGILIFRKIKLR